jgi:hypothetical protein
MPDPELILLRNFRANLPKPLLSLTILSYSKILIKWPAFNFFILAGDGGTVVEHSMTDHEIKGSNPASH